MGRPYSSSRARLRPRTLAVAAVLVAAAVAGAIALTSGGGKKLVPAAGNTSATFDPLGWSEKNRARFERDAAAGESHVIYAKSPGGVIASAKRTARFRPLVDRVASVARLDPDTLEAIVFLESAGRPDVIAGNDPQNASGLTQILAETGQNLLGMRVDLAKSRKLTKQIAHARTAARAKRLRARRRRVDQRFDPRAALAATARYLGIARKRFGRDDLAVTSYHMGIGNLQNVLRAYGGPGTRVPYAQLYFDSTPIHHPAAWGLLYHFGDDSSNYYWKILGAEQVMRLYRTDPGGLARLARLQKARASAEVVLHPPAATEVFADSRVLAEARAARRVLSLPNDPRRYGFRIDPRMGELAPRVGQKPALYRGLRPEALGLLTYMAAGVRAIAGKTAAPLDVTSTVRDLRYQRVLAARDAEATHGYSLHTTGFTFDVLRSYSSHREAVAFQFMLDRLQALNLIAWVREPRAIHVTVSSAAKPLESLIGRR